MKRTTVRTLEGRPAEAFTSSEAKSSFGTLLDTAQRRGVVTITKHDKPSAVVLSMEAYETLLGQRADPLAVLRAEFDRRMARMQTPKARAGMDALFSASPAELGRAAVRGARRRG